MNESDKPFPRFFCHTYEPQSDALIIRHDSVDGDAVVTTILGVERPANKPWTLEGTLSMVKHGRARELSREEAAVIEVATKNYKVLVDKMRKPNANKH